MNVVGFATDGVLSCVFVLCGVLFGGNYWRVDVEPATAIFLEDAADERFDWGVSGLWGEDGMRGRVLR